MDLAHLSYFSALYETLNYTEAARKCYISRQAMRQSLQTLEQAYGIPLIENRHNHLHATEAGKLLYSKAQNVLTAYEEMNAAMHSCITAQSPLRIGISRSVTPYYAPDVLSAIDRFEKAYSGIPTEILLLPADDLAERLGRGELDAGIWVEMGENPELLPRFTRTILRTDPLSILLSVDHPLASRDRLTLQDLSGQTVMLMGNPKDFFRPLYQAACSMNLNISWKTVPDYYEVTYQILKGDSLAIDRPEEACIRRTNLRTEVDLNLPLENNAFTMHCTLLTPPEPSAALQIFRQALKHR